METAEEVKQRRRGDSSCGRDGCGGETADPWPASTLAPDHAILPSRCWSRFPLISQSCSAAAPAPTSAPGRLFADPCCVCPCAYTPAAGLPSAAPPRPPPHRLLPVQLSVITHHSPCSTTTAKTQTVAARPGVPSFRPCSFSPGTIGATLLTWPGAVHLPSCSHRHRVQVNLALNPGAISAKLGRHNAAATGAIPQQCRQARCEAAATTLPSIPLERRGSSHSERGPVRVAQVVGGCVGEGRDVRSRRCSQQLQVSCQCHCMLQTVYLLQKSNISNHKRLGSVGTIVFAALPPSCR